MDPGAYSRTFPALKSAVKISPIGSTATPAGTTKPVRGPEITFDGPISPRQPPGKPTMLGGALELMPSAPGALLT